MRSLLACTVLVLAVSVIHGQDPCVCKYDGGQDGGKPNPELRARLDAQAARLSRTSAKAQELISKIERGKAKAKDVIVGQRHMSIRLRALEGNKCSNKWGFYCGGLDSVCVGDLLVCDGNKDCPSGRDEDEALCRPPVEAGDVFEGGVYDVDVCTKRRPHTFKYQITSTRKVPYFTNHLHVNANLILISDRDDVESQASLPVTGHYCFARSRLVFYPPEDDRLAFACQFEPTDPTTCQGSIFHEQSEEECLTFVMSKA